MSRPRLSEPRPGPERHLAAERGDTLLELLIAIVVLSFGVLGIYSTIGSSIGAADGVKSRADASQLVTRVADAIQRAPWECTEKPNDSYAEVLAALKPSAAWIIQVSEMRHWGPSRSFEDGCPKPDDDAVFKTLKMFVLVKAPGGRGTQFVELLKRP